MGAANRHLRRLACGAALSLSVVAAAEADDASPAPPADKTSPAAEIVPETPTSRWHGLLVAGHDASPAFENGRARMTALLLSRGASPEDLRGLSRTSPVLPKATLRNIEASMSHLTPGPNDPCLFYLTSHGVKRGALLGDDGGVAPPELDLLLDRTCGDRPTVVLISACFSGQFVSDPVMQADNRVILTASRHDRSSFGCSVHDDLTYWDACLLDVLPTARRWDEVYEASRVCVEEKEARLTRQTGNAVKPSLPQAWIGPGVADLSVFGGPPGAEPAAPAVEEPAAEAGVDSPAAPDAPAPPQPQAPVLRLQPFVNAQFGSPVPNAAPTAGG
jgi:hypothetical protein